MLLEQSGFISCLEDNEDTKLRELFEARGGGKKPPKQPPPAPPRRWELPPPEEPPRQPIRSSKGYPEVRDPAADGIRAVPVKADAVNLHKSRLHYGPAVVYRQIP